MPANTITNGFDATRVFTALQGRLGWHQPTFQNCPILDAANKSATSGRYFDRGFHKAVSIMNYWDTTETPNMTDAAFNLLLKEEDQGCIMRAMNAIFNRPALIESKTNYNRIANIRNVIISNTDQVCGYRFNIAPGPFAVVIDEISLLFDKDVTFTLYLFNDLLLSPVYSQEVSAVANTQTIVKMVDPATSQQWIMNSTNTETDGKNMGGVWYMFYFQRDIEAQGAHAIDEQLNMWADTKIFGAYPFQAPRVGELNFNRLNPSVNFRSYGMNMRVSSYRDYTQKIVDNPSMWDEARGLLMACVVIEQLKYNTRTDATQRNTSAFVDKLDLDMNANNGQNGQYPFASGLRQQLQREYERINANFWPPVESISVPIGYPGWGQEMYYEGMDIRNLPSRELPR